MVERPRVTLIVETSLGYGRAILRGISRYVVANQPWSMYLDLHELHALPPPWLTDWDGDGVISRMTTPEMAESLLRRRIPLVDMTDYYRCEGVPHIYTDHYEVARIAAVHLRERGFRNLAFCGFSDHRWSCERRDGFLKTLSDLPNVPVFESRWQLAGHQTWEQQQDEICNWLASLPRPVGIMAANDLRGYHVLDACRRLEISVPEDVAVIGVDNDETLCLMCDPPLSSVATHAERIGYEAAQMLDGMMSGGEWPQGDRYISPSGIVTRQSTDILAIDDPLVTQCLRIIRERACEGLIVDDLLSEVPTSRSILERRFRKFLNRSPQEEIRLMQIKRIKQLLAETELPLHRIAELSGFEHPEYMSVVFKRELGITPGQFRKQATPPDRW